MIVFSPGIDQMLIVTISALAAAASFIAFAWPYLNKTEQQEKYQRVIQKKRKALFTETREEIEKRQSARESLSIRFSIQQKLGAYGEKLRDQMLQAGIRDPKAPMNFLLAKIIIPLVLAAFTLLLMSKGNKDFSVSEIYLGCLIMIGLGFAIPSILVKNHIQKRQQEINITFPDSLDMMLICVQGGIGLEQTINRVADEVSEHAPILAEELGILSAEMGMLNDRRAALQDFARRVGSGAAKSFATAMIQAEQYGTSISNAMRVISEELRDARMGEAERKAASLPPKLTVPMILFFLPALFIVILGPAFLQAGASGAGP
ncbi:MAG: type II secretion system F family protein [Pseudomonadota bacterium]